MPLVRCWLTHQRNSLHWNQLVSYSRTCPLQNRCTAKGQHSIKTCATMSTSVCYRITMPGE